MDYTKERDYVAQIEDYMREHDRYDELWTNHCELDCGLIVKAEIHWGDWKHDHLYHEYLMEEYAKKNDLIIIGHDSEVTEEDGSDCYSAIHTYRMFVRQH